MKILFSLVGFTSASAKELVFYNSPFKYTAAISDSLWWTNLAAHVSVGTWETLMWKPRSSRLATSNLLLYPASSESRTEETNEENVVSRENKRCAWAGKRARKPQLVHGKDTGRGGYKTWARNASAEDSQRIHGQTAIRTALRKIQAISLARHRLE